MTFTKLNYCQYLLRSQPKGTPERKIFEVKSAIELWRAIATDLAGVLQNLELRLAYCPTFFTLLMALKLLDVIKLDCELKAFSQS